jgi:thioredoxin-like negative regulator of GroEL
MLERGMLVIGLALAVLVVALVVRAIVRRRAVDTEGQQLPDALLKRLPGRDAGIVYFYGPHCGTCRQQAAILDRLSGDDGIAVVRVDATSETALADALAVMTVPATVIVDGARRVRAVNLGLRSRDALLTQLRDRAGLTAGAA